MGPCLWGLLGTESQLVGAMGRPSPSQQKEFSKGHSCAEMEPAMPGGRGAFCNSVGRGCRATQRGCGLEAFVAGRRRRWAGQSLLVSPPGALGVLWSRRSPL